jgi:hypothetical protein
LKRHHGGFLVSGSQGIRNRETVSNSLISISLKPPGEVVSRRMAGKPICHRPDRDSGSASRAGNRDRVLRFVLVLKEFGLCSIERIAVAQ